MNLFPVTALLIGAMFMASPAANADKPENPGNGQVYVDPQGPMAWSAATDAWLPLEQFWLQFTDENEGKFWGRTREYPPYGDVGERDALLIELEQGACLMYFWHSRWRRAQDVWRWDEQQNALLGCPYVFD